MIFDLIGFDFAPSLVLLLDRHGQMFGYLIGDVIDVSSALGGGDGVDEGYLLKATLGHADADFPAIAECGRVCGLRQWKGGM